LSASHDQQLAAFKNAIGQRAGHINECGRGDRVALGRVARELDADLLRAVGRRREDENMLAGQMRSLVSI